MFSCKLRVWMGQLSGWWLVEDCSVQDPRDEGQQNSHGRAPSALCCSCLIPPPQMWQTLLPTCSDCIQGGIAATLLQDAGVTHIWLPPPSQSVAAQGYLPGQLYNLDSQYGNKEELQALCKDLKAAGIQPLADIVINHRCADEKGEDGVYNTFRSVTTLYRQCCCSSGVLICLLPGSIYPPCYTVLCCHTFHLHTCGCCLVCLNTLFTLRTPSVVVGTTLSMKVRGLTGANGLSLVMTPTLVGRVATILAMTTARHQVPVLPQA